MWAAVVLILTGLGTWAWMWSRKKLSFFRKHGVPEEPGWFLIGSRPMRKMVTGTPFTEIYADTYKEYKDKKMVGTYGFGGVPNLLVMDMDLIKTVLVKDFDYLADRRDMDFHNEYLDNMLTVLEGEKWKQMRTMMSPIFTSGKLKATLPLLNKIGDDFVDHLEKYAADGTEFEAKAMMTKFSLEVIASTGFGVSANAFNDPDGAFSDNVAKISRTGKYKQTIFDGIKMVVMFFLFPQLTKYLKLKFFDEKAMNFFITIIRDQIKDRQKNPGARGDFIDILTQVSGAEREKSNSLFKNEKDFETAVISNAFIMFFAGFDTSSTGSSLTCYYLATNQDVQEKVYQEIKDAINENDGNQHLDYNTIQQMKYLDQCLQESFRVYPTLILERRVSKPYKVPGTDLVLPKGTMVTIPGVDINRDPEIYENPEVYNPDNYSDEEVGKRGPYADSTFGHGPRNCVGKRFALLQLKISMVRILANYKLVPCEKTVDKLVVDAMTSNFMPKGGMWMKAEKRE